MVKIKICGVRDEKVASILGDHGVDFAGLNFVSWSKRVVDPATAERIVERLGTVTPVGVFYDQTEDEIRTICDRVSLTWVQLHGKETPGLCQRLAVDHKVIKAVAIGDDFSPPALESFSPHVDAFLFDAPRAGSGTPFDWSMVPAERPGPIFLAGGLDPENVHEAIRVVRPFAVDTASGVEENGIQSPDRIRRFAEEARRQ